MKAQSPEFQKTEKIQNTQINKNQISKAMENSKS
jgi:hypothetical protein